MNRLLLALALVSIMTTAPYAQSCGPTGCDTTPPAPVFREPARVATPTYRVCFRGLKTVGDTPNGRDCKVCMLKASSSASEKDCHDFYSADDALRFWNQHCCD